MNRDEEEEGRKLGQDVTDAFPLADYFIRAISKQEVARSIRRFIELLFGFPYHTPAPNESGMFHAYSAALRSADLSRQVGAAITNLSGDIITVGCNEVPKAGGGQYWAGTHDYRDFQRGFDSSELQKREIIKEIIHRFCKASLISGGPDAATEIAESLLSGHRKDILSGTQVMNLLEFGRIVHAEMAAISDAARRGLPVDGAVLYTTTFPCHMCARHIIAAGVRKVVYIEPYPKSLAKELYDDSIVIDDVRLDEKTAAERVVNFETFSGVAPRRYLEFFRWGKRKDGFGQALKWDAKKAALRIKSTPISYLFKEVEISGFVEDLFVSSNYGSLLAEGGQDAGR